MVDFSSRVEAKNFIRIGFSNPFTVPTGKILLIVGLGTTAQTLEVAIPRIFINGVQEGAVCISMNVPNFPSVCPWTDGLVGKAGDIISTPDAFGRIYGYLMDAI